MPTGHRDGIDGFLTQLIGDLSDLFNLEPAQILRSPDGIEQRGFAKIGHGGIQFTCREVWPSGGEGVAFQRSQDPSVMESPELGSLLRALKCAPVDHCDPYHPFQRRPSEQFCELYEALNTVNGQQNCAIVIA
jgi:hypothetical protein